MAQSESNGAEGIAHGAKREQRAWRRARAERFKKQEGSEEYGKVQISRFGNLENGNRAW